MTNDLRKHAEARLALSPEPLAAASPAETQRLLHELRVHQIELEMQNEELRSAQAEIEAGRARYFDLYDLAPVGYVTVGEKGVVLEANLTAATLLGVNRAALVRQPLTRFMLKEDQDLYYLLRKRLADGSGVQAHSLQTCELRMVKPDGSFFWAQLNATATEGPDGAPACRVVISDITELKKSEEALRESDLRFRHLLQHVPNVAVQGYGPDGTTLYWNDASERLYGYTAQEALGRNLVGLIIPPEMRAVVTQLIRQMAETGQQIPAAEVSLMRKDGSRVSVFSSHATVQIPGQPLALFCMDIDITEHKRAEASLKQIEWMLSKNPPLRGTGRREDHDQGYGDLTQLNRDGIILKSIGLERLKGLAKDYLDMLGTSSAIYEANGDYAYGIFSSGWCRMMDCASRNLCDTPDNTDALNSGRWLCHESCWTDCCKQVVADGAPVDIACHGGIRMYAVPIRAHGNIVGVMNFGYGDPPKAPEKLSMLAETYHLDYDDLIRSAHEYDSRPPFIIELAKKRLHATARLIGAMIETKQAEEALEVLRQLYQSTLDGLSAHIAVLDDGGEIIFTNKAYRDFAEGNEINPSLVSEGVNYLAVCDSTQGEEREDAVVFAQGIREVLSGKRPSFDLEYPCHSPDEQRWFMGRVTPVQDKGGRRVVVAHENITERKVREAHMVLLVRMLDEAPAAITIHDTSGRFLFSNLQNILLHGCASEEEFMSVNLHDLDTPESEALLAERFQQIAERGVAHFEVTHRRKDGSTFPLDVTARAIEWRGQQAVLSIALDITDRKLAEAKIEQESLLNKSIIESIPGTFYMLDEAGKYVRWSAYQRDEIVGKPDDQIAGFPAIDTIHPDDRALIQTRIANVLRTGVVETVEGRVLLRGGPTFRWLLMTGRQLVVAGHPYLVGIGIDITARKQAEEALQRSDALQCKMISNIGDVIVIIDENGINRYKSENIAKFFGWKPEEVVGESALANVHPDDLDAAQAFIADLLKTPDATGTIRVRYRCKDGSYKWISFTGCNLLHDPDIHGILGNYQDITEHKLADDYRAMGADIMQILNKAGDLSDVIQPIIATLKARTGFDAVGLRLQAGEDFPYYAQDGFSTEFLLTENTLLERGKDGGVCRDKDGKVCLECTCGLVISGKTDPASPLFTRSGSCWTNDSFPLLDLPADQDPRRHPRNTCIHDGYASVALIPIRNKDKIVGLIHLNDRRKGRFTLETVELLEDITAHIGEALMRKQAEAQLIQSQKLEAIGTLAGGVAHEINNPIMGIMGYAQLIRDRLGPDSPVSEFAAEIGKETERVATIVSNLLGFARQDKEGHHSPARLCDIVESTLSLIRATIRHDQVTLEVDVPADLPQIKCRSQQIQQVIMNLLTNARDALNQRYPGHDANKKVIISARAIADVGLRNAESGREEAEGAGIRNRQSAIRITVEDHGAGIPEELRARIFEPFFTTKPRDKGTGLGLSISHGIVKDHGGELRVESAVGEFTRFHIDLPLDNGWHLENGEGGTRNAESGIKGATS
jgi:PAS domain S-box-containing protein